MIILISGATHTGKTVLAQELLEVLHIPYLSIDHLKMGLIRTNNTGLSVYDDVQLTDYLWPIIREIIKTAIENNQNLVIEGIYIPFNWQDDFDATYLKQIYYFCLVMTTKYIENYYDEIFQFANSIEKRLEESSLTQKELIDENNYNLKRCQQYDYNIILIDDGYDIPRFVEIIKNFINLN